MAEIYEASEETKRIIEDWANSPFEFNSKAHEAMRMPYEWLKKQPKAYQRKFTLTDRERNTPAWEEAAQQRRNLRKSTKPKVVKPRKEPIPHVAVDLVIPDGDEHLYIVKIEGNSTVTGYGQTTNMVLRAKQHTNCVGKDGSHITQWDTFGFQCGEAKAVEKLLITRFPLAECTISGFQRESTDIDRYDEVVEFVEELVSFIRTPIKPKNVETLH